MPEDAGGSGQFRSVTLHPQVTLAAGSNVGCDRNLHTVAHRFCFLVNSVKFPVAHHPTFRQRT